MIFGHKRFHIIYKLNFDVLTSFSTFGKIKALMLCYLHKQLLSSLELVPHEFDPNKKELSLFSRLVYFGEHTFIHFTRITAANGDKKRHKKKKFKAKWHVLFIYQKYLYLGQNICFHIPCNRLTAANVHKNTSKIYLACRLDTWIQTKSNQKGT